MKRVLLLVLSIMTILLCACGNQNNLIDNSAKPSNTEEPIVQNEVVETEEPQPKYAKDLLIDHFISDFNEKSPYEISDISEGNIRTKYHCKVNGTNIDIVNATEALASCLSISIHGGKSPETIQSMFDVFYEIIKIVDSSMTEEEIKTEIQAVQNSTSDFKIVDNIQITYIPSVELSYGLSNARIDMDIFNYVSQ